MRISTNTIFKLGSSRLSEMQAGLSKTQQQLSTQRRVLTPADDPVASATALGITQSLSINQQFASNREAARSTLSQEESVLQSVTNLLHNVKTLIVTAGSGALEDEQRQYLTSELRGYFDELMGLANSRDGTGNYMFSGYATATQPFSETQTGAAYGGDQGVRMLQVGSSRQIPLNDTGTAIFQGIKTGNRTFVTAQADKYDTTVSPPVLMAGTANTGSGIVGTGAVVDAAKLTGHNYSVIFSSVPSDAAATPFTPDTVSYVVKDNDTGRYWNNSTSTWDLVPPPAPAPGPTPVAPWMPYVSGQAITFDGIQIDVTGKPGNGDTFSVEPSRNQDIFTTVKDLLATLTSSSVGASGQAHLTNGLNAANNNIDNMLDNVLNVRASVGTRLSELDVLDSGGEDLTIQYTESLRVLTEVDNAEVISNFQMQQMVYQAAQQSFVKISRLSLFDHI